MWRRKKIIPGISDKIVSRVAKMNSQTLNDWMDQALYSTGRSLTTYQKTGETVQLSEAYTGAQVIYAIVDEMVRRDLR